MTFECSHVILVENDEVHSKIMARNTSTNKRLAIKWVRDRAKSAYEKQKECFICKSIEELELHHVNSLTNLFDLWARRKGYSTETDDDVLKIRDEFIDTHHSEIYEEVFTLCSKHHNRLHGVYGKSPPLTTAKKQILWIEKQKAKHNGTYVETAPKKSFFGKFLNKGST